MMQLRNLNSLHVNSHTTFRKKRAFTSFGVTFLLVVMAAGSPVMAQQVKPPWFAQRHNEQLRAISSRYLRRNSRAKLSAMRRSLHHTRPRALFPLRVHRTSC
jgi:hypothetical protein